MTWNEYIDKVKAYTEGSFDRCEPYYLCMTGILQYYSTIMTGILQDHYKRLYNNICMLPDVGKNFKFPYAKGVFRVKSKHLQPRLDFLESLKTPE